jgi:hypothetical protein
MVPLRDPCLGLLPALRLNVRLAVHAAVRQAAGHVMFPARPESHPPVDVDCAWSPAPVLQCLQCQEHK